MSDLRKLSIKDMIRGLRNRDFSACELTQAYLLAIESEKLNAYVTKLPEKAMEMARVADSMLESKRNNISLLTGIPIAVKDLFCTKGIRTTACSKILHNFVPTYESGVTEKLWNQYAVMLGKVNMDEFAMGSTTTFGCFGSVINPLKNRTKPDVALVAGGSSGGSAAAVAGFLCAGALGSDTGGSVRQPASFCGVVGMKPTYGRCSRWGMIAFASSLDQAGVLARSVEDVAVLLEAICGYDKRDSTSLNVAVGNFSSELNKGIKGKKIGIIKENVVHGQPKLVSMTMDKCIEWIKGNGAEVVEVSLPILEYALPVYYIISSAEASSNLARYDGVRYGATVKAGSLEELYIRTRTENFGSEVKRRIMMGTYVLSEGYKDDYYGLARVIRNNMCNSFKNIFQEVDYLVLPTTPNTAFAVNEQLDAVTRYLNDVFTVPASLVGLPVISVPALVDDKSRLPVSIQVVGRHLDEAGVLGVASVFEKCAGNILQSCVE